MKLGEKFQLKKQPLSDRDTMLLFVLGIVVVIYVGFHFLIIPKFEVLKDSYNMSSDLSKQYKKLKSQNDNIAELEKKHNDIRFKKERMELQLPPFNSQAHSILALENEAKICNLKLGSMSFEEIKIVPKDQFISGNSGQQGEGTEKGEISGPSVVDSTLTVAIQGNYTEIYKFLKRLEENDRKYYINNLSLNVGEGNSIIGNMKLQLISYLDGSNIVRPNINIPETNGKFDIFSITNGPETINKDNSYYTPDMLLRLNPDNYMGPKFVFSEYGKFDKEIYDNSVKPIEGKLSIEKRDKKCIISYSLANTIKTVEKEIKPKDGTIKFDVISSPRTSMDDSMAINMTIENKTPFVLEINVINDDLDKPKFNLVNEAENIHVKKVTR